VKADVTLKIVIDKPHLSALFGKIFAMILNSILQ